MRSPGSAQPRSRDIQLSRLRMHCLEWKSGAEATGPPLLLVHPNRTSADVWRPFAAFSRLSNHMVAPDLRGHGSSEWPADGYSIEQSVADLRELVETLSLGRVVLVGSAIGGTTALLYATRHPSDVVAVVATDVGFAIDESLRRRVQDRIRTLVNHASPEDALAGDHALDHMDAEARQLFIDSMFVPLDNGRVRWRYHPPGVAAMMDLHHEPLPEAFDVRCPTLLLRGAQSKPLSRPDLARLAAAIDGARAAEVPDADHILSLDNPEALAALVDDFVEEVTR